MVAAVRRGEEGGKVGRKPAPFFLPIIQKNPPLRKKALAGLRKKSFGDRFAFMNRLANIRDKINFQRGLQGGVK